MTIDANLLAGFEWGFSVGCICGAIVALILGYFTLGDKK